MSQTINQRRAFKDYKTRTPKQRARTVRAAKWIAHKFTVGFVIGCILLAAHFAYSHIPQFAEFIAIWIAQ